MPVRARPSLRLSCLVLLAAVVGLGSLVAAAYQHWLPSAFTYLDVTEEARPADAIVVLGGSSGRREARAAELYAQGYAPIVLVSGQAGSMEQEIRLLRASGVPEAALLINDRATSTYNEAQQVIALLTAIQAESALIITDRFHSRRALAAYRQILGEREIDLHITATGEVIDPASWWTTVRRNAILDEYPKMLYYWLVYGVWSG